jgi:multidrug efflux pump subunit AcrB
MAARSRSIRSAHSEIRFEEPILKRRDRTPVITIRSDINEATQPPEVSKQVMKACSR